MFGSSFFYIQSCSNNAIISPCILAVNQNGLNFLSKETHVGGGRRGDREPLLLPPTPPLVLGPLGGVARAHEPLPCPLPQEPMAKFSLKEIQSTRTQRPAAGSSSPYVEITLGELLAQGITQLQLEQVGDARGCPGVTLVGVPRWWHGYPRRVPLGRAWSCAAWWPRTWRCCWVPGRRG